MAALNVAWIDDVRICAENLSIVYMAKSPVLVSLVLQRFERTGCVVRMFGDAGKICVQNPNVEETGNRLRIIGGQILCNFGCGKTLAMYCNAQGLIRKGLWLAGTKDVDVARRPKLLN